MKVSTRINCVACQALIAVFGICLTSVALAVDESAAEAQLPDIGLPDSGPQNAPASAKPLWEAGLFGIGISQPAYPGADQHVRRALPLPYLIYRGRYLRAERGNVGVRAVKTQRTEVDVGFAASLGSSSSGIEARQGMENLGTMIEFGPRLKINLGDSANSDNRSRLQFPLRVVIDISHGFVSRGIAFEPEWVTDFRLPKRWFVSTSLGVIFGDSKLTDTLYGVAPSEATPTRPAYTADSGLIALRAKLVMAHSLTPDVRVFTFVRIESLAGAANLHSPLVRRDAGWTAGIGLSWRLAKSERDASD